VARIFNKAAIVSAQNIEIVDAVYEKENVLSFSGGVGDGGVEGSNNIPPVGACGPIRNPDSKEVI